VKKYNHIIVVGGKEAADGSMNLRVVNQPNEEATFGVLEATLGKKLDEKEKAKGVQVPLDVARKYFEDLANAFM
jgi:threonyl-tRNA synthetase